MNTSDAEWSRLLSMANEGDGFAVDHLVEGKLRGCLPPLVEDSFDEQCFLYWTRDSLYTEEVRKSASCHDMEESEEVRDRDTVRIEFRLVDEKAMRRLIGIGLEGSYEVSVSFHPHSQKKVRVELQEELEEKGGMPLLSKVRAWEAMGFKMVRDWAQRRRTSSVRTLKTLHPQATAEQVQSRGVWYSLLTLPVTLNGRSKSHKKGLVKNRFFFGLREDPDDERSTLHVMRLKVTTDFFSNPGSATNDTCIQSRMKIQTSTKCELVDGECSRSESGVEYSNGTFGSTSFDCGKTDNLGKDSSFSCDTLWMLTPGVSERVTVGIEYELGVGPETEARGFTKLNLLKWLCNSSRKSISSRTLSWTIDGSFGFMDDLKRSGRLRRVRNTNRSWKLSEESKLNARKASIIASARF